jgi:hypothetical protein
MESWTCETLSFQLLSYRQPALFTDYYSMATPHEEQRVAVQCSNFVSPFPPPPPPPPPPQYNVVNNAETTFGNIPWYKLNTELGERGFKNGSMIQHGVYHKNTRIFYWGKIVSSIYVQDCSLGTHTSGFVSLLSSFW